MSERGLFIVFEGLDGVGKTTQARLLRDRMNMAGRDALVVAEGESTELGRQAVALARSREMDIAPLSRFYLFCAARQELVHEHIVARRWTGKDTICDRYAFSAWAYGINASGLPTDFVYRTGVIPFPSPDLYIVLWGGPVISDKTGDFFESKNEWVLRDVRDAFALRHFAGTDVIHVARRSRDEVSPALVTDVWFSDSDDCAGIADMVAKRVAAATGIDL